MSSSQSACKIHEGRISAYKGSLAPHPEYPHGRGLVNIYWMNKLTKKIWASYYWRPHQLVNTQFYHICDKFLLPYDMQILDSCRSGCLASPPVLSLKSLSFPLWPTENTKASMDRHTHIHIYSYAEHTEVKGRFRTLASWNIQKYFSLLIYLFSEIC